MIFYKYIITGVLLLTFNVNASFFNPTIKTSSNKKLNIVGQGPPFLFSTGLFGIMPSMFYGDFVNLIKKNISVITIDGFNPITEDTIDEVCEALRVDKIGYLGHSSFFPEVLNNKNIENAILIDPINLPWINFEGLSNSIINIKYPILVIRAGKLYNGSKTLPHWQDPDFRCAIEDITYADVGHPDILDNTWANIAKKIGLWEMAETEKMDFKNWKFKVNSEIPKKRKNYRKFLALKIGEFLE